jgi:murein DD-endopeptidase MepM/ murein hydrolase activator NlpD
VSSEESLLVWRPLAVYLELLIALSSGARACPGLGEAKLTLPSGDVVLAFGQQKHPILVIERFHPGVDYATKTDTPVTAAGAGEVVFAERDGEFGLTVAVMHGGGLETRYGHLHLVAQRVGDCVSAETIVGYSGSTGLADRPKLHFEVRRNGKPVDPLSPNQ